MNLRQELRPFVGFPYCGNERQIQTQLAENDDVYAHAYKQFAGLIAVMGDW